MKLNRILSLGAVAATLALGTTSLLAQDNNNGDQGGQRRQRQGGQGGQGGGQGGQGNWDPAQMQQRMMERYQEQLGFTNDTDWQAVKPLVQKVSDARMASMSGMGRGMFGGGRNRGGQGGQGGGAGGMFGQPNPEHDALQKALDDNAPASQIKDLLAKYKASQKAKQAKLETAQAELKAVLTTKQEAQAVLMGLVN